MFIRATQEDLHQLADKTGQTGAGLAGTVPEALAYLDQWTAQSHGDAALFFQFVGQAEQMRDGVRGALEHMRDAFDGFSQAVEATAEDLNRTDQAGADDYNVFDVTGE